ncbi:hypothetical protein UlMin_001904 [Ulmus minor]
MRQIRPPLRYGFADVIVASLYLEGGIINYERETYSDAIRCKDSSRWKLAIEEEMQTLRKNNTWEFVTKPEKHEVVDCKWIYKIKEGNTPGDKVRHKARLVAKGFTQREGIYFIEIFSSIVKYKTIRMVLAIVVQLIGRLSRWM